MTAAVMPALAATVDRKDLLWAAKVANAAASRMKSTNINGLIRLSVADRSLIIEGTDALSWSVRMVIPAERAEEGVTLARGALVEGIADRFDGDSLSLELTGAAIVVKAGARKAQLATQDPEPYPAVIFGEPAPVGRIDGAAFRAALKRIAWAMAPDESRPVLFGVYGNVSGGRMTLAAGNGFTLAECAISIEEAPLDGWSGVIDARAITSLIRDLPDGACVITATNNRVRFVGERTEFTGALREGNFPQYESLVPLETSDSVMVDRAEFAALVDRATLVQDDKKILRIRTVADGLETHIADGANAIEDRIFVNTKRLNSPWHTTLSTAWLKAALTAAETAQVRMQPGGDPPGKETPVGLWAEDDWRAVIMPIFANPLSGWAEGVSK